MSAPETIPAPDRRAPRRRGLGLAVLLCAVLLISIDLTVLNFAIPSLSEQLEPTATQLLWVVDVYGLVIASLLLFAGALGDRIGRRRLLMVGVAGFGVASVLAAYSTGPELLIAARALQGAAGATLMPSTLSLIRRLYPGERERRRAIGLWSAAFATGAGLGPLLGGYLLEHFWWGSVFLVNVPIVVAMLAVGPWVLPGRGEDTLESGHAFDVRGVLLGAVTVFSGVFALKEVLTAHDEGAAGILLPAVAAVVCVAAAVAFARHLRRHPHPLVDPALFSDPALRALLVMVVMATATMTGSLYLLTQQLQIVYLESPLRAAVLLVPGTLASGVASVAVARLARVLGSRNTLLVSLGLMAVGFGALVFLPEHAGGAASALVLLSFVAVGVGTGLMDPVATDAIVASVPPEKAGSASAVSETAYELGGGLGVALFGGVTAAVYAHRVVDHLGAAGIDPGSALTDEITRGVGAAAGAAADLPAGLAEAVTAAGAAAFTDGLHLAALMGVVLVAGAALLGFRAIPRDRSGRRG